MLLDPEGPSCSQRRSEVSFMMKVLEQFRISHRSMIINVVVVLVVSTISLLPVIW